MQTKLSHTNYNCFETVNNESIECPIDIEYSLPEYLPDIQKILKCIPYVEITTYSFTQDKFMCEGKLVLYVQYMDEKTGCVRVCEIVKEYSQARDIEKSSDRVVGKIHAGTGHIICRAISARKLDIHVPVVIDISFCVQKQGRVTSDADGVEKRHEKYLVSHGVNAINHQFVIEQEIELPKSSAPIESILRKDINVKDVSATAQLGKIQLEGMADISLIYRSFSESLNVEKLSCSIPFIQYAEYGDIDTDNIVYAEIDVCEFSVQPKEDYVGDNTICSVFVKMNACLTIYKNKELSLITDAYSVASESKMKYDTINLLYLQQIYKEKLSYTKSIFLADDEIEKLLDYWCEDCSVTAYPEKNRINYRGKYSICLVYQGRSKQIFCITKAFDFTCTKEFDDVKQRKCDASIKMSVKDFRIIDGNNIEFTCEGMLVAAEFVTQSKKILADVEISDSEQTNKSKGIVVYYSKKDELLWDIGKTYHIPVSSIMENNSLTDSTVSPGGPLVIF